jgi:predicted DsbA family dithiol-disulfide isomerase
MTKSPFLLAAFAVVAALGCSKSSRPSPAAAGKESNAASDLGDPAAPMAKVAGQVITAGELATAAKAQLGRIEAEHAEKVHETKSQVLDGLIDKRLVDAKAKAEGVTPEKLIEREVTAKIAEPSEAEVQSIYERTKQSGRQLPPLSEIKGDIVKFIKERGSEQARKTYMDKLRAEAKVQVLLPPLLLPRVEVAADGQARGKADAPVTIIEFSDYQCPFCSRAEETVKKVMEEYKGKVRLVYRDYPLPFHGQAQKASEAAQCAADQGKYWEMHEKLFSNQSALGVPQLKDHAKGLGLDAGKFGRCLDSGEKAKLVESSKKAGDEAGVNGTPAFFINGRPLSGAVPFEKFKEIIDYELRGG